MTKEEKCPTCGGPAIDRNEYWETCWEPVPPTISSLLVDLRRQIKAKDELIAKFDFDVVPRLMDEIQARQNRIGSLEAVIHCGLVVTAWTDDSHVRDWRDQAKDTLATLDVIATLPQTVG